MPNHIHDTAFRCDPHHGRGNLQSMLNTNPYRPDYPPSTTKLITDYHRAHSNSLRLAHCIGLNPQTTTFLKTLADYFQHIHVSDPDPDNITRARAELGKWYQENWWKAKFSFSATGAEEAELPFAERSVDFCCLMNCAWRAEDVDGMVGAVGRSLTPNGTLVVVEVGVACRVVDDVAVDEAVQNFFRAVGEEMVSGAGNADLRGIEQRNSGVDYVPLLDPYFIQDVTKRIKINVKARSDSPFAISGQEHLVAASRVGPLHREYEYARPDAEAEGWSHVVDAGWFRKHVGSLTHKGNTAPFEQKLKDVEASIRVLEKVVVDWPVAILLATKK
ncbi:methyltransferase gedG-like [Teratosphaeria destructans]|uniref:Methyltransferase gedG-like n=1 Tax=Teratosphaeria destructans TaxID=418781 RepID=A0A9W7W4F8_9PEZI|nr:methyltransferase gedG-like [Teratosphaeria destructans]